MICSVNVIQKKGLIKKLADYRDQHNLSQERLARLLGISLMSVNLWLNNKVLPNSIQMNRISRLLSDKPNVRQVIVCVVNSESYVGDSTFNINQYLLDNNCEAVIRYVLFKDHFDTESDIQQSLVRRIKKTLHKFPDVKDIVFVSDYMPQVPVSVYEELKELCSITVLGKTIK